MTKELFGEQAHAKAELNDEGVVPHFFEHGEHQAGGPALTALGALAFDLAALRLAIADKADLPGLWIHDSPRDANLGPGRYASLLDTLVRLDREFGPSFQYILTTTDSPPRELRDTPLDEIHLGAATDSELLLGRRY